MATNDYAFTGLAQQSALAARYGREATDAWYSDEGRAVRIQGDARLSGEARSALDAYSDLPAPVAPSF